MSGSAVITGASLEIGRRYARRLASASKDPIVVGRRRERLDELATNFPNVSVQTVLADPSTQDGIGKAVAALGE